MKEDRGQRTEDIHSPLFRSFSGGHCKLLNPTGTARMAGFDAHALAERLRWEQQDYWLHMEAESALEKYPGAYSMDCDEWDSKLMMMNSETARTKSAGDTRH